jgi:RNA polymerase sigma-70 factor, ECF subfamily
MDELTMASSSTSITELLLAQTRSQNGSHSGDAESSESVLSVELEILGLFDVLRGNLLRYAISFGLSVHDGEDIIQEVFLALFHHLQEGRSRSNLRGWVFRVTHNLALKRRVSNQNVKSISDENGFCEEYSDPSPGPEEQFLFSERQECLLATVRALPENDRWCLRLRAEGLRYREISEILGISLGSVSTSLARSLARLERTDKR